ncbi:hypothetical protein RIF29_16425 [Crotalaria pallida]|uniref:Cytochrome b561 and DOMON domain-containing protein n=1 Tax=Crotalaria pallida TaxID=3830 RepID=A0AAN9FFC5_CROPI
MKLTNLCLILLTILCSSSTLVISQESCSSKLEQIPTTYPFDTTKLLCSPVRRTHKFFLRYAKASSDVWSFIFSFPADINAYAGIGFSKDGSMVDSSALVGWMPSPGAGGLKGYYLGGKSPDQIIVGKVNNDLQAMNLSINPAGTSLVYIVFQLKTNQPTSNLLFAIGPNGVYPDYKTGVLTKHSDKIAINIDYSKGTNREISFINLRRSHGVLNIAGWSILMIIGSIISRYFKQWDPIWFYLHASVQIFAFVAGVIGILCGFSLSKKLNSNVTNHKNIAILIIILGCLQVLAIKLRPGPESKIRKYWNWYHHNVGRILIIFAVINTFYGLHLGAEGSKWFLAYGVSIVILVIVAVILEIRMWIIVRREAQSKRTESYPQSTFELH